MLSYVVLLGVKELESAQHHGNLQQETGSNLPAVDSLDT
jgi:hypothetical protein